METIDQIINRLQNGASSCQQKHIDELPTPCFVINLKNLKNNAQGMINRAKDLQVELRPHIKTHKSIEAALYQLYGNDLSNLTVEKFHNTAKITVSTLGESDFFATHGFQDILYAVPIIKHKLQHALELTRKIRKFSVLVDSLSAAKVVIEFAKQHSTVLHVFLDIDTGYNRTGINPKELASFEIAKLLASDPSVKFEGIYTHAGNSYHSHNKDEASHVSTTERDVIVEFANILKAHNITCPTVAVGSTPTCSNPAANLQGVTEIHPGNYIFYDLFQSSIGSCSLHDNAGFVISRVLSQYADPKRLLIDAGALALSKDTGPSSSNSIEWGKVQDHDELHITRISQEVGIVEGEFDSAKFPEGTLLKIIPNHSCLTAACYEKHYVVDDAGNVLDVWKTCPRLW
jgi:D-serine deaminase-like pyridoxal phosphate-dependent protein